MKLTDNKNMDRKAIVIFFSHAGENYSVGHIEVGNTKIVADYISEITGADQFEIVAEKDYDLPYMDLIKVAQAEANAGELPAYKGDVDVAPYDIVFIGGPIWWGTYPQVMFSFFKDHDLSGKTVIQICIIALDFTNTKGRTEHSVIIVKRFLHFRRIYISAFVIIIA